MSEATHNNDSPTVVLVHGAFADASSWNGVIERLQAKGVPVTAPANPLRGIAADSAYIAAVLEQIDGPVVAVGHSYGGAVITNAATDAKNVVGLVYVAAFAPDEGETLGAVAGGLEGQRPEQLRSSPGSTRPRTADRRRSSPSTRRRPATPSRAISPTRQAALIAATQRPVAELAFSRAVRAAGLEGPAVLGRRRDRRQGRRDGRRPLDGGAGRRDDHRGRGLARDHGLAAPGRDRRDPRSGGRRRRRGTRSGLEMPVETSTSARAAARAPSAPCSRSTPAS